MRKSYFGIVVNDWFKNYNLIVEKYLHTHKWTNNYYRGTIYYKDDPITTINGYYQDFWHCWVEQKNKFYLIYNENLYKYAILDIENKKINYYNNTHSGWGPVWKKVTCKGEKHLIVESEYLTQHREIALYEFHPTRINKVKILGQKALCT